MMTEVEAARHASERGLILRTLKEDYITPMTSVNALGRALDSMGVSLAPSSLDFHLVYLAQQQYVQIWRASDMPGHRTDRAALRYCDPNAIVFAKLLPRGLQLVDGDIGADSKVAF
jgi:hypothetical protein